MKNNYVFTTNGLHVMEITNNGAEIDGREIHFPFVFCPVLDGVNENLDYLWKILLTEEEQCQYATETVQATVYYDGQRIVIELFTTDKDGEWKTIKTIPLSDDSVAEILKNVKGTDEEEDFFFQDGYLWHRLYEMPFDRDGKHATGYEWWDTKMMAWYPEYED